MTDFSQETLKFSKQWYIPNNFKYLKKDYEL